MALDLDFGLVLGGLFRRVKASFEILRARGRRQPSRRARAAESSHNATEDAILSTVSRSAASLRAFSKVLGNPQVRNVQIAGAGSILGTWAYAVALPVFAYHAGGPRA